MTMAMTVQDYLQHKHAAYNVMNHPHTQCSMETAATAHIPGDSLAKSVILGDDMGGYMMAVVPSTCHVGMARLSRHTGSELHLASEQELAMLFGDCEIGAIPAVGTAYGLKTVIDKRLMRQPEVYFEAGDHEGLVHMSMSTFLDLMADADRAEICFHM